MLRLTTALVALAASAAATPMSRSKRADAAVASAKSLVQRSGSGAFFDRFAVIFLENTDYAMAAGDPNLSWLATQGITLTNYFGVTVSGERNFGDAATR